MKNKAELVLVPTPATGHLVSIVELAKHLLDRHEHFSITVLLIKPFFFPSYNRHVESLATSENPLRYIHLPPLPPSEPVVPKSPEKFFSDYLFFPSSAAFLGPMLHLPIRHALIGTEFSDPNSVTHFPSYANPVLTSLLPTPLFNKDGCYARLLNHAKRFREAKGIIINAFEELESYASGPYGGRHQKAS